MKKNLILKILIVIVLIIGIYGFIKYQDYKKEERFKIHVAIQYEIVLMKMVESKLISNDNKTVLNQFAVQTFKIENKDYEIDYSNKSFLTLKDFDKPFYCNKIYKNIDKKSINMINIYTKCINGNMLIAVQEDKPLEF